MQCLQKTWFSSCLISLSSPVECDEQQQDVKAADDVSSGYSQSVQGDIPEEVPIAGQDGEPLEEARMVSKDPDEAVVNVGRCKFDN